MENGDSSACPGAGAAADVRDESKRVSHIPAEKRQSDLYTLLDGGAHTRGKKEACINDVCSILEILDPLPLVCTSYILSNSAYVICTGIGKSMLHRF